jgi:hypothetical protein
VDYWETALPGFGLRVTPTGVKTWFYWYRVHGRAKRWTIGRYPLMALAEARDHARRAYGHDPAGRKSEQRQAKTVAELADEYLRLHAMVQKKTWQRDQRWIARVILPAWRDVPVVDLRRQEIRRVLDTSPTRRVVTHPAAARCIKPLLSKMFNFALPRDYGIDFNPVQDVQTAPGGRRTRNLTDAEIGKLLVALDGECEAGFISWPTGIY